MPINNSNKDDMIISVWNDRLKNLIETISESTDTSIQNEKAELITIVSDMQSLLMDASNGDTDINDTIEEISRDYQSLVTLVEYSNKVVEDIIDAKIDEKTGEFEEEEEEEEETEEETENIDEIEEVDETETKQDDSEDVDSPF